MKIPTKAILEFKKRTSAIQTNSIIPVLEYIKLTIKNGKATLEKSNLEYHCAYSFDCSEPDTELLLHEEATMKFVEKVAHDTVNINVTGDEITLSVKGAKCSFVPLNIADFPGYLLPDSFSPTTIGIDAISALYTASKYCDKNMTNLGYVHCDNEVFGSNNSIMFYYRCEIPKLTLKPLTCSLLGQFSEINHFTHGNQDYFISGDTVYITRRPETNIPNYKPYITNIAHENGIKIKTSELIRFCELSSDYDEGMITIGETFILNAANNDKRTSNEMVLEADNLPGNPEVTTFKFNIQLTKDALKALQYEHLELVIDTHKMSIYNSEDKNYLGLIAGGL